MSSRYFHAIFMSTNRAMRAAIHHQRILRSRPHGRHVALRLVYARPDRCDHISAPFPLPACLLRYNSSRKDSPRTGYRRHLQYNSYLWYSPSPARSIWIFDPIDTILSTSTCFFGHAIAKQMFHVVEASHVFSHPGASDVFLF